jgi:murein DD-endopeptidase MepM/ murein hydrolase activator NlpD
MRGGGVTPAWTLIIVPPTLTSPPRRVGVKMRWIRMLGMLAATLLALSWMWMTAESRLATMVADRLADEQRATLALRDTLQSMRNATVAERARISPPVNMVMPVNGAITSRFSGSRFHPILQIFRSHKGVDLSADAGTRIVAPALGRVTSVGWRFGYGLTLEIAHTGGVVTRYAHLRSAMVKRGDSVAVNQAIATVGSSGLATGPHLHFEVLVRGTNVDPIKFVAASRAPPPVPDVAPIVSAAKPK